MFARTFATALIAMAALMITLTTAVAHAAPATEADYFGAGTEALREGKYQAAIDQFEAYADRSPSHPDASFNRGIAYLARVRNGAERPGDLGRAAAAFEETLAMRPGDDEAEHALSLVQGEVARRRARRGRDALLARPTLERVIVNLASERSWGIAAVVASLLLGLGLVMRRRPAGAVQLAGSLLAPASAVALLVLLPLCLGARHLRLNSGAGVLVVREAHMADDSGASIGGEPIPEAARLEIGERQGRLIHVRYGAAEGWIPLATVRVIRTR